MIEKNASSYRSLSLASRFGLTSILLWVLIILTSQVYLWINLSKIEEDAAVYEKKNLLFALERIQNNFHELEKTAFSAAHSLISSHPSFASLLYEGSEQQKELFEHLLSLPLSQFEKPYGIACYNQQGECISWQGRIVWLSPRLIAECLQGKKFSAITSTEEKVYSIFCSFMPVFNDKTGNYPGLVVVFTPLDTNYPISSHYIKQQSFAEEMRQRMNIQEVTISFEVDPPPLPKNGLQGPLKSLNNDLLGWVTVIAHPIETKKTQLRDQAKAISQTASGILLLFLTLIFLRKLAILPMRSSIKIIWGTFLIWNLRYWIGFIELPRQFFPDFLFAADIFWSPLFSFEYFGDFSGSLADLLLTALTLLSSVYFWFRFCDFTKFSRLPKFIRGCLAFLVLPLLFVYSLDAILSINHAIVKDASYPLFFATELSPSWQGALIYVAIHIFGLTCICFCALLMRLFLACVPGKFWRYFFVIIIFFAVCFFSRSALGTNVGLFSVSVFSLCVASLSWLLRYPKRDSIRWSVVLFFLSIFLYPGVYQETRSKKRTLVEDQSREYSQDIIPDILEQCFDRFENNEEVHNLIEEEKDNAAFLLWANSPLSDGLDNLEIQVFSLDKTKKKDTSSPSVESQWENYQRLSVFTMNMPSSKKYKDLEKKLQPDERAVLVNELGNSTSGEGEDLFYVSGCPLLGKNEDTIGFLVILSRYQKMTETLPLPEVFSKKSSLLSFPLLQAYFDRKNLVDTNAFHISKTFFPSSEVVGEVYHNQGEIWTTEKIDGETYDCLYFPYSINKWVHRVQEKSKSSMLVTMDRMGLLGYPLHSKQLVLFYFLQFFLTGIFILVIPFFLGKLLFFCLTKPFSFHWYLSFEQKLLLGFSLLSLVPVFLMGVYSKNNAVEQIWENYNSSLREYLINAEKSLQEEKFLQASWGDKQSFCHNWGRRNQRILNIFEKDRLRATSSPELFQTELISRQISGHAYYNLMLLRKEIYIDAEALGDYTFVVGYKALYPKDQEQKIIGAASIPMIYEQTVVQQKIAEMISTIFTIYLLLFLVVLAIAVILAYQITRPLTRLIKGIDKVSQGDLDVEIPEHSQDEIGQLVKSFNRMTKDLKISRDKLVQAEKNAAWREMARQIAHEIKNPLTPMKLFAQHILRAYRDQSPKFPKILEKGIHTIISSIDSLSNTASSFSEFSRFTQPNLEIHQVDQLVREELNLLEQYREQNIQFELSLASSLPPAYIDGSQFKRVLINVLTNAVHAIEQEGKIKVKVYLQEQENFIVIEISDNGMGVPEDIKPRLFEPNFSTKSHGSGLGLAICKRSMDSMKGSIEVESEWSVGTIVTLKVPIYEEN